MKMKGSRKSCCYREWSGKTNGRLRRREGPSAASQRQGCTFHAVCVVSKEKERKRSPSFLCTDYKQRKLMYLHR